MLTENFIDGKRGEMLNSSILAMKPGRRSKRISGASESIKLCTSTYLSEKKAFRIIQRPWILQYLEQCPTREDAIRVFSQDRAMQSFHFPASTTPQAHRCAGWFRGGETQQKPRYGRLLYRLVRCSKPGTRTGQRENPGANPPRDGT